MFFESFSCNESLNYPVTHLLVVCWNRNKSGLNHRWLELNKGSKQIKLTFDFLNSFFLVCNHLKCRAEVTWTYERHNLQSGFLLFLGNKWVCATFYLGHVVARDRDEVYRNLMLFVCSCCKWAVFKASQNVSTHAKFKVHAFEIDQTSKFTFDCFFDRCCHLVVLILLKILCEDSAIYTHECRVVSNFENADVLKIILIETTLNQNCQWLDANLWFTSPVVDESDLNFSKDWKLRKFE